MNVLITGANGFVGKNLTARMETLRDGRDRTRPSLQIGKIYRCTRETSSETLVDYCQKTDFVVHLAGVNRPKDPEEFVAGNADFTCTLLEMLRKSDNRCPVLLSSSIQAGLTGRYAGSPYGQSKKAAEELLFAHARETGAQALVYRLPNLFGKWCRPNYNSAVATFCHNIARDLPITVSDPAVELELVYIDDLVEEILNAVEGHPHRTEGRIAASRSVTTRPWARSSACFGPSTTSRRPCCCRRSRRAVSPKSSTALIFPICRRKRPHFR